MPLTTQVCSEVLHTRTNTRTRVFSTTLDLTFIEIIYDGAPIHWNGKILGKKTLGGVLCLVTQSFTLSYGYNKITHTHTHIF